METNKQPTKQTTNQLNKQQNKQTNKQATKQTTNQPNKQKPKQTNKQTKAQTNKQTIDGKGAIHTQSAVLWTELGGQGGATDVNFTEDHAVPSVLAQVRRHCGHGYCGVSSIRGIHRFFCICGSA